MKQLNKFYPHLLAILGFVVISLIYFYPVLQGRKIYQSDIAQYTGMAKEQNDFRAIEHSEPYWTNSGFGGMPTYQLGANYPHDYVGALDDMLRSLPRPADYLFLYFASFYILLLVLKTDPLKAFFGALAFGFSTYLIIILGVGHNAKAHAIAYMPLVIAGVLLVFKRRFVLGGILTMLAAALEINANHFQMTYYLLILLIIIGIYYAVIYIKAKDFKSLGIAIAVFIGAGILAIGANAGNLLATSEYAEFSTRGKSELTVNPDGTKKQNDHALTRDYITEYSYGIAESFNLIAPRLFGGGNSEKLDQDSHVYEFLLGYGATPAEAMQATTFYGRTYWGNQPIVAAPAYIGAVVFFLAILALFHDKRKLKYVFLIGAIVSLLLSWGKNLPILTNFFIDFVPMYNKFRAVSSIQVILELCLPVLAIMGLQLFFTENKEARWPSLWKSGAVSVGLIVLLFIFRSAFDFAGASDNSLLEMFNSGADKAFGPQFIEALQNDRKDFYSADLLRSGFLICISFLALWFFIKEKFATRTSVILVGIIMILDLYSVDKRYVNSDDFVSAREVEVPFQQATADAAILEDKSNFRVFEVDGNLSSARSSYFHKSLGGYHAAKPRRIQQLFDYQISQNNLEMLNMLNVKYIIQQDEQGEQIPTKNSSANGNAWFISKIKKVATADAEIKSLTDLDSKSVAIVNQTDFPQIGKSEFVKDSTATISLDEQTSNYLKYTTSNANDGVAIFSEIYYPKGWNVTIDGKPATHFRANYILRAMEIPAGKHTIVFKFEPQVIKTGGTITLFSCIMMLIVIGGGIYFERKKQQNSTKSQIG